MASRTDPPVSRGRYPPARRRAPSSFRHRTWSCHRRAHRDHRRPSTGPHQTPAERTHGHHRRRSRSRAGLGLRLNRTQASSGSPSFHARHGDELAARPERTRTRALATPGARLRQPPYRDCDAVISTTALAHPAVQFASLATPPASLRCASTPAPGTGQPRDEVAPEAGPLPDGADRTRLSAESSELWGSSIRGCIAGARSSRDRGGIGPGSQRQRRRSRAASSTRTGAIVLQIAGSVPSSLRSGSHGVAQPP